jgi:chromosome segregation ATPase
MDSNLRRIEDSITRIRGDIQKYRQEEMRIRDKVREAIKRLQFEETRNINRVQNQIKSKEREIEQLEMSRKQLQARMK